MKNRWFIIAVLFPVLSFSQENASRPGFNTVASLGIVAGESTAKPSFQLVSGLTYTKWFAGIGAGLDYFNFKSIPIFADVKMKFGKTGKGFLYADGGYNFPFGNKSNNDSFYKFSDKFLGGFYMDAGIGYRLRLNSLHRFLFSAGYSRKDIVNKVVYEYPCITGTLCAPVIYRYHYSMGRIVAKVSWEFGK